MHSMYQRHIDILRALAVLLVIFNHLDFVFFSGGFIGVDIFFVISGYLITKNIVLEKSNTKTFSFKKFYQRRVLRLAPAFFTMLIVSSLIFYFIFTPQEWSDYLKTAASTVSLTSNIYYATLLSDYFSISSQSTPLLHIWSLSLEEQFYLIWPLLLLAILKLSKNIKIASISLIIVLSLICSHLLAKTHPIVAYYILPSRMFEFLIGAVLVFVPLVPMKKSVHIILSITSIFIILASSILIDSQTLFPSYIALIPCLATALFIYAGQYCIGSYTKWVEYIGKISYPMYLWHWPIIVYLTVLSVPFSLSLKVVILLLTLMLSYLTYEKIEKKITKNPNIKMPIQQFFILPALLVILLSAIYSLTKNEEPQSVVPSSNIKCIDKRQHPLAECIVGDQSIQQTSVFLIGDSHANAQSGLIDYLLRDAQLKGYELTMSSSAFLYGVNRSVWDSKTQEMQLISRYYDHNMMLAEIIRKNNYKYVIMGGYFPHNWNRNTYSVDQLPSKSNSKNIFIQGLKDAIMLIESSGATAVLINDNPILRDVDINCHLRSSFSNCSFSRDKHKQDFQEWMELLSELKKEYKNLKVIDMNEIICDEKSCYSSLNDVALYRDRQHLSYAGAEQIGAEYLKRYPNPFY